MIACSLSQAPAGSAIPLADGVSPVADTAVLLSTYDGERFLGAQLDSIATQESVNWRLFWRDDGSEGPTPALMRAFASTRSESCIEVDRRGRLGVTQSFLCLLREAVKDRDIRTFAFADQDDVWLPGKLARGRAALARVPDQVPALYCARQVLVDEQLNRIGASRPLSQPPGFPAAVTQNVATGCTTMLNRAAAELIAASEAPSATLHDWWCYIVVAAAEGRIIADDAQVILYRQHARNFVGAPSSLPRRALAALRRGPGIFMAVLRQHVAALEAQPQLLTPATRAQVATISAALRGGPARRLAALTMPGLRRQTWQETLLFRLWFLTG